MAHRNKKMYPGRAPLLAFCAMAAPAWAVNYNTVPQAVTAGAATQIIEIWRTGGDEGYSEDEMTSFNWYGPSNPFPTGPPAGLPPATLVAANVVRIRIDAALTD